MKVGIIDADLIGKKKHRFPNLACMKISGYYKSLNDTVELLLNYDNISEYDIIFISKVFTDTPIPENIINQPNVKYGGTGFYMENATSLPSEIEHHMPDYHLYDIWVLKMIDGGVKPKELEYYTDHSIGFITRGCFRKCSFCVNKKYDKVELNSQLEEFLDNDRKYICLLDDNILGYYDWENIINQLKLTNKYFQFKQGMDIRLMTPSKAELLSGCRYRGDYIFAFDDIDNKDIIESKLLIWKQYCKKSTKLYVLCGYDKSEKYDDMFWVQDIINTFQRLQILMSLKCLPYLMRYKKCVESPYNGTYINLSRWCNQPNFFKKMSYREFCQANQDLSKTGKCSTMKYLKEYKKDNLKIDGYYNMKYPSN